MAGAYRYGDPASGSSLLGPKPPCWATSKYDNDDRECRTCGFQQSCREQNLKLRAPAAPSPTSSYFTQFQPPTPLVEQPKAPKLVPIQVPPQAPVSPVIAQTQAQQPPPLPNFQDRYGQFQDPMFTSIKSSPSVMRPQQHGETFHQRVLKNMALASIESMLGEMLLGIRQFLWSPKNHDKK